MNNNTIIEQILAKPYWVIDFLPKQVPSHSNGQFFEIEKYFLSNELHGILQTFTTILLKLNCYYDFEVCRCTIDEWTKNPTPKDLTEWVMGQESLCIIFKDADAMITINSDDTHMTLYNPNEELIELTRSIANSESLFLWKPNG